MYTLSYNTLSKATAGGGPLSTLSRQYTPHLKWRIHFYYLRLIKSFVLEMSNGQ